MLRFEVGDAPPIDLDESVIVIGSAAGARIRLPARVAQPEHVRIAGMRWQRRDSGDSGDIGADGVVFAIGEHRVRVSIAPAGAIAAPAARTESLARELVRDLLGDSGAPTLAIVRGPVLGAKRALAPPESSLVIGRGDEATWVIFDGDLSRAHVEVRRGWDGVRVFDRGSKNGTRVGGVAVGEGGAALVDGATIELGNVIMRFDDPAERHLRGEPSASTSLPVAALFPSSGRTIIESPAPGPVAAPMPVARARSSPLIFYAALAVAALAASALVYLLAA